MRYGRQAVENVLAVDAEVGKLIGKFLDPHVGIVDKEILDHADDIAQQVGFRRVRAEKSEKGVVL